MDSTGHSTYFFDEHLFLEMEEIGKLGMYAYDVESHTFEASPHFQKMFHLPQQSSYPADVLQALVHPDDEAWVMHLFRDCIKNCKPFNCDYRCLLDGEIVYIRSRSRIECDAQGNVSRLLGVKQDISEQKSAELEQSRLEQQYLKALGHSPIVFAQIDTDLRYEWIFNPHTDFDPELVSGKRDDELSDNPGTQALMALKKRALQEGTQCRERITFELSDGPHTYEIIATPSKDKEGKVIRLFTASLDITELQAKKFALQDSERKLHMALQASQSGIFEIDVREDEPPEVTGGTKKLFGFDDQVQPSVEDFVQRVHPEDQQKVAAAIETSIGENKGHYIEYRVLHPDGKVVWLASRAEMISDEDGLPQRLIGTLIDISERKRDEEALRRSQQLAKERLDELETIYDTAPVGMCVLDRDLRFVRINQVLAEINGFTVEEHIGKTIRELMPKLADDAEPALRQVLETGEPIRNIEINSETPSQPGVQRTWIETWYPYKNSEGETVGINIVAEEITERKKAEERNRASEERYRRLFNSIEDGFAVCELLVDDENKPVDYRFLEVNHTFESHTGLKNATGKTALQLVPDLEHEWIETYAKVGIDEQNIRFEQGSDVMGKWFDVYAFPFGMPGSRIFAIQFKDISERKVREEELAQYREKLAIANQELGIANEELRAANEDLIDTNRKLKRVNADLDQFVYTASHDLKAPITNLYGLLEMLQREAKNSDFGLSPITEKALGMMELSVKRFMQTIGDMTDISRLQKQGDLPMEEVDLPSLLQEVTDDLALAIEQSGAQIDIHVDDCKKVFFAAKNLRSIIYNLLSNAIKYRDPQRQLSLRVACREVEGYHQLTFEDNGLGIEMKQRDRMFAMFQRLHNHVEGTGVGLYIVKKMLENAGGKIDVESEVGVGTTFKVFIKS
jgi:PAS domain S-box-containing protein